MATEIPEIEDAVESYLSNKLSEEFNDSAEIDLMEFGANSDDRCLLINQEGAGKNGNIHLPELYPRVKIVARDKKLRNTGILAWRVYNCLHNLKRTQLNTGVFCQHCYCNSDPQRIEDSGKGHKMFIAFYIFEIRFAILHNNQ